MGFYKLKCNLIHLMLGKDTQLFLNLDSWRKWSFTKTLDKHLSWVCKYLMKQSHIRCEQQCLISYHLFQFNFVTAVCFNSQISMPVAFYCIHFNFFRSNSQLIGRSQTRWQEAWNLIWFCLHKEKQEIVFIQVKLHVE